MQDNDQLSWLERTTSANKILLQFSNRCERKYTQLCAEQYYCLVIHFMGHEKQRNCCSYLLLFHHFVQHAVPPSPWLLHQLQSFCIFLRQVQTWIHRINKTVRPNKSQINYILKKCICIIKQMSINVLSQLFTSVRNLTRS